MVNRFDEENAFTEENKLRAQQAGEPFLDVDWQEWQQTPSVEIWAAVFLSTGLNPAQLEQMPFKWLEAENTFKDQIDDWIHATLNYADMDGRNDEIRKRFRIVEANFQDGPNPVNAFCRLIPFTPLALQIVPLSAFAAWSVHVGWDVPDEFHSIASNEKLEIKKPSSTERDNRIAALNLERATLLKILLGIAIDAYDHDPDAKRSPATGTNRGSIFAGLEKLGTPVTDDTIRKYLKQASEMYPGAKPQKKIDC